MRKIVVTEFITLDGVIEDPGGAEKFKYGGWSFPYGNDEITKFKLDELFATGAHLLGRVTYEGFAKAWPTMKDTGEFGERMNNLPKYVVSTTLEKAEWNNSSIIKENIAVKISKLKQQSGQDILVAGSATLIQTLMKHNLIDEYHLLVHPIVLGSGKRLFRDESNTTLRLVETRPFSSGVVALTYQPAASKADDKEKLS
jgi:dihydrofolate reductase